MTLYINELEFANAKVANSSDGMSLAVDHIHGSNYPDIQKIGVNQARIKITLTVNSTDVEDVLARLRGTLRNHEFAVIRSTDQHLRDNKKNVFVKIRNINAKRTPGTKYHSEIELDCAYVGTQASHQLNYFINSTQVPNDWKKVGTTAVALVSGATAASEVIDEHPGGISYVRTPTWASGETSATYDESKVYRGTVGFNATFDSMFKGIIKLYDGPVASGKLVTDTDHDFEWIDDKITVRQDNWLEMEVHKGSGQIIYRKWDGSGYSTFLNVSPNSGGGIGFAYPLVNTNYYVRLGLDTEDELELFLSKIPSIIPSDKPILINTAGITGGTAASGNTYNFIEVKDQAWVAGNREFSVTSGGILDKSNANAENVQYWFGWESGSANMDKRALDVLRRLE